MNIRFQISAIFVMAVCAIADQKEQPVGLVLSAGGSKLRRSDAQTPLATHAGDLLFSGDTLKTEAASASFVFCPDKSIQTMAPSTEVRMETGKPRVKIGKLTQQPARSCILPQSLRIAVASQQYYGVTMTRGTETQTPPVPRDKLAADVVADLIAIDPAYGTSEDPGVRIAVAGVFEKHDLLANSLEIYYKLREQWPDAVWVRSKIFDLEQLLATRAAVKATTAAGGQTYALLVGISKYKRPELSLQFANADADTFSKLLATPRGGAVPRQNILLLTDEKATTAAVRNAFQDFLKRRAGKNDTVILVIAGHGTVEVPGSKNAFVLTYDSDPQDLASTALPMSELRSLFEQQLKNVGHVLLFVDICKAGTIGSIQNTTVSADVQHLGDVDGDLFGFLASRPKEISIEGPEFGGGHGVFSYFVLKGLAGAADANKDGTVDANELIQYVSAQVASATSNRQHPREFGTYDNGLKLADVTKPGIDIAHIAVEPRFYASLAEFDFVEQPVQQSSSASSPAVDRFESAIRAGRLLATDSNNVFDALKRLQAEVPPDRYFELANELRIALENRAQEVLLRYLAGDQNPQSRQDFALGARYMEGARTLTHESLFLEGREDFFDGRALLFDKKFPDAEQLLEQSVRLDPGAAYGYNALGIAYLEQGQFDKAIPAFRDAFRRAQHWSYPLHNEALAHIESGDYQIAIRLYQQAMRLTPDYAYLPYNLGLVYQRINRRKEAEASYRKAISLAPSSAEPLNALGTLRAAEGKRDQAEKFYRDALQRNSDLLAARNNLAILLAGDEVRRNEALDLFRENLRRSPDYLPSRLGLAQSLADSKDAPGSIAEYRRVLGLKPGYLAARIALAELLAKSGDQDGAIAELHEALKTDAENPEVFEQIGDIEATRSRNAESRAAYSAALQHASDRSTRKRIESKLRTLR